MKAHELHPAPGSTRARKRVGRGISAGQGKTAGRGQKGQGSRSSVNIPTNFEGGQMPLAMRLPKLRGFNNFNRKEFAVVNLGKLARFEAGTEVNPQLLEEAGLVKKMGDGVKILAAGKLDIALKVSAHRVSAGARAAIEAAGGSVELLGPQPLTPDERAARATARKRTPSKAASDDDDSAAERPEAAPPAASRRDAESPGARPSGEAPGEPAAAEPDAAEPSATEPDAADAAPATDAAPAADAAPATDAAPAADASEPPAAAPDADQE